MRLRARTALAEARAQMPSLLEGRAPAPTPTDSERLPSEAAGLRRALREYTDHVDQRLAAVDDERRALREQVARLSAELETLRGELVRLASALPPAQPAALAGPAAEGTSTAGVLASPAVTIAAGQEPDAVAAPLVLETGGGGAEGEAAQEQAVVAGDRQDRAGDTSGVGADWGQPAIEPDGAAEAAAEERAGLEGRVFPAGSVGVNVVVHGVESVAFDELLRTAPAVESVQVRLEAGRAHVRLTLRRAVRWPELRETLEAAAGKRIDPAMAGMRGGVVSVVLRRDNPAEALPPAAAGTT